MVAPLVVLCPLPDARAGLGPRLAEGVGPPADGRVVPVHGVPVAASELARRGVVGKEGHGVWSVSSISPLVEKKSTHARARRFLSNSVS